MDDNLKIPWGTNAPQCSYSDMTIINVDAGARAR